MVVIGASKRVRSSYKLWEEPKAPDFVLEIASESTYRADSGTKRDTYAEIGVSEYWQADPAAACLRPSLQGFRLVEGAYRPIGHTQRTDGTLVARSDVLGLELHLKPGGAAAGSPAFFMIRRAGKPLRSLREEAQARREAEGRLRQTQDRLRQEQAARQALEAELRALRRARGLRRLSRVGPAPKSQTDNRRESGCAKQKK